MTSVSLLSSSLVFVPSVVAEASIGVASSADIVFCRFVGGLGEVMLNNRLVLKRLNDETIKGDVGYCTVVLRVVEIDSNSKLLYCGHSYFTDSQIIVFQGLNEF